MNDFANLGATLLMLLTATSASAGPAEPTPEVDAQTASSPRGEPAPPPSAPQRIGWLLLDSEGVDETALREHLRLRLPGTALRSPGDPQPPLEDGEIAGLVRARRAGEDVALTLTFTDGRTYDRAVVDPGPTPERTVASELSSLARAALEGRVDPDRMSDADFVDSTKLAEAAGSTAAVDPANPPDDRPEGPRRRADDDALPHFGLRMAGLGSVGVAPALDVGRGLFGGAELGLDIAWPIGAVLSLGLSGSARGLPLAAQRLRGGIGAGYRWQRGAFEWLNVGRIEIEAWFVADDRPLFVGGRQVTSRPPLLGLTAISSPGWFYDGRLPFRVGPRLELGIRGALGDPRGAPRLFDGAAPGEPALLRLGGLELGVGGEVQLWFGRSTRGKAPT